MEKIKEIFTINKEMRGRILNITIPSFLELFLSSLFGIADMIMLGRASTTYIAAAGLSNQPSMLLIAVFAAVNVGATTMVAWNIGANNREEASKVTTQVIGLNAVAGLLIVVIGLSISRQTMIFMGATPETLEFAHKYFNIIIYGLPFLAVSMAITASLRGAGETKLPMYYNLGFNLFNVFGNYCLIYGNFGLPALGVEGAAWSTTISRMLACFTALYIVLFSNRSQIKVRVRDIIRPSFERIKSLLKIGAPATAEQFVAQSGFMLFAMIAASLGTDIYSAHLIGLNICGLTFSASQCFSITATTIVGQCLGAGNREEAMLYVRKIRLLANIIACIVGAAFLLFGKYLAMAYTTDIEIAAIAGAALNWMAFAQPGQSTQLVMAGALRGAGDTIFPLIASLTGIWFFRVIVAYIFVRFFGWGLMGAWATIFLDQYLRAVIVMARFMKRGLVKKEV